MITVKNNRAKRTIHITMSGFIKLDEMEQAAGAVRRATDEYGGAPHLVLADMRGLKAVLPEVADAMGTAIGYTRAHGVVHCAHLSDSSTVRLQASRLVREAVEGDPATTNVVSLEEAERVLDEVRAKLPPLP
jgi:hypothetical protein